jgi:hypothetical protein
MEAFAMSDGKTWPVANVANQANQLAGVADLADGQPDTQRDGQGRFLSGNNGGGRKKGSRNKLTETFISTIEADFAEHGPEVLAKLRDDDPASYMRIIASLVPRDLVLKREIEPPDYSDMPLEELEALIQRTHHNAGIQRMINRSKF